MRCHPLRWLWGLLPLAVWAWVTLLSERPKIEADLSARAMATLKAAGLDWAHVAFKGRDGTITGRAVDDSEPTAALRLVNNNVWGVRIADAQAELIEKVDTYLWSATIRDGNTIRLTGYVPNEAARRATLAAVKADFPKWTIEDHTKLARGAPEQSAWLNGIKFGAKQLAGLKTGHLDLSGLDLSLAGEAQSTATYGAVKTALKSGLPKDWKMVGDRVTPPRIQPYVWTATTKGDQITLTGYVPDERTREAIVAHAGKGHGKVVDKLLLGAGAPDGLQRGALLALDQIAHLKDGTAELKGSTFTLVGEAANRDAADAIRAKWKSGLPSGFKESNELTFVDNSAELAAEAKRAADAAEAKRAAEAAEAKRAAEAAEAKRAAEAADAKRAAEAAEAKRAAEAADAKRAAEAADAKRAAEAAEAKRAAEAAEAKRAAEAAEAKRVADAKRAAEDAEAKRVAAIAEQRKAEASRCEQMMRSTSKEGIIRFERASADLHGDSRPTLDKLAKAANTCPGFTIEIEGHTDAEGTPERNKRLSERRAQSIVTYLTDHGVDPKRLQAIGYGETRPVAPNDTPEGRAKNRRIEFTVKTN